MVNFAHHPRVHLGEREGSNFRWEVRVAGFQRAAAGFCRKLLQILEAMGPIYDKDDDGEEIIIETVTAQDKQINKIEFPWEHI